MTWILNQGPYFDEKIPNTSYVSILLNLKFGGLGIGYGISKVLANQGFGFSIGPKPK